VYFPLVPVLISTCALNKASPCRGQNKVSQKTNEKGETKQTKERLHRYSITYPGSLLVCWPHRWACSGCEAPVEREGNPNSARTAFASSRVIW
jgi:hypothetical protein